MTVPLSCWSLIVYISENYTVEQWNLFVVVIPVELDVVLILGITDGLEHIPDITPERTIVIIRIAQHVNGEVNLIGSGRGRNVVRHGERVPAPVLAEVNHLAPPLLSLFLDIDVSINAVGRATVFIRGIRSPAVVGGITVECGQDSGVVVEPVNRHNATGSRNGQRRTASLGRLSGEIDINGVLSVGHRIFIGRQSDVAILDALYLNKLTTGYHQPLTYLRHIRTYAEDDGLPRSLVIRDIRLTAGSLDHQSSHIVGDIRHFEPQLRRSFIPVRHRVEHTVLYDRFQSSDVNMVATNLCPLRRVEFFGRDVGEISLFDIREVKSKDVNLVARLPGIQRCNAGDGRVAGSNLKRIRTQAMSSFHAYLVLQVAVKGRQLKAVLLRRDSHHDRVVGVHRGIEVSLLVVDIHLQGIAQIVTYQCDNLSARCLCEKAVSLGRVTRAHSRYLRSAAS